jgi:carbon monoxide dehydrogenase subunit G
VEIEKVMRVAAPAAQVWNMLLDPKVMGSCVPGMKSIDVISDVEYVSVIHVKISFISAKFRLKTTIVEQQAPHYLRCEGTGEDASVASSLKQQSEIFLVDLPDGQTELRMKVKVDVLGRLGTFGLSIMKTKADRMWEEFGQNLVARLEAGAGGAMVPSPAPDVAPPAPAKPVALAALPSGPAPLAGTPARSWWQRLVQAATPDGRTIHIELRRGDTQLTVDWPVEGSAECAAWLREVSK